MDDFARGASDGEAVVIGGVVEIDEVLGDFHSPILEGVFAVLECDRRPFLFEELGDLQIVAILILGFSLGEEDLPLP